MRINKGLDAHQHPKRRHDDWYYQRNTHVEEMYLLPISAYPLIAIPVSCMAFTYSYGTRTMFSQILTQCCVWCGNPMAHYALAGWCMYAPLNSWAGIRSLCQHHSESLLDMPGFWWCHVPFLLHSLLKHSKCCISPRARALASWHYLPTPEPLLCFPINLCLQGSTPSFKVKLESLWSWWHGLNPKTKGFTEGIFPCEMGIWDSCCGTGWSWTTLLWWCQKEPGGAKYSD